MKGFSPLVVSLLFYLMMVPLASASDSGISEAARKRIEEAKDRLELSDKQVELAVPVFQDGFQRQKSVLEAYGIDIERLGAGDHPKLKFREARKLSKELGRVRDKTLRDLEGILSAEQLKELKQLQSERKKAIRKELQSRR